jgi:phage-related protein
MPLALPLTDQISQSSARKRVYRTLTAQFGDGYMQTTPDGTNNIIDSWNVVFENLGTTDRATLYTALNTVKGSDYLTWTPPGESTVQRFKINKEGVSEQAKSGDLWNITVGLTQVFGG